MAVGSPSPWHGCCVRQNVARQESRAKRPRFCGVTVEASVHSRFLQTVWILLFFPTVAFGSFDCSDPAKCTVVCDATNDHTDINSAISGVNSGGTVSIAAGSCTISGMVTITKPMTLAGAGSTSTTFVGGASPMVTVAHGASGFARVTGIHFNSAVTYSIQLKGTITQVRIDNNKCSIASQCIYAIGSVEGVIDHNEFVNCDRCFLAVGASDSAWTVDYNAGTGNFVAGGSHALFIEDNTFERNASFALAGNELHYTQEGARTVFRHNVIDATAYTAGQMYSHDTHANQFYYDEPSNFRGQPIHEIYGNIYLLRTVSRIFNLRSGSNLIFNNTFTVSNLLAPTIIRLWEEEAFFGAGQHFTSPGFDYVWPTEDMVTNTFIWGNTLNGSSLTTSNVTGASSADCCGTYPDSGKVINFNRDAWMHAPESSGGRTFYNGRPGASGRNSDGTLVFTTSGANAYFPYSPYVYPHPLALATPKVPTGLSITPE